jgi:ionotropic glutamate receptor
MFLLVLISNITASQNAIETEPTTVNVGVILDLQSLVGKIAHISILMALEDFYSDHSSYRTKLVLHMRDSNGEDIQAASAGTFTICSLLELRNEMHKQLQNFVLYIMR